MADRSEFKNTRDTLTATLSNLSSDLISRAKKFGRNLSLAWSAVQKVFADPDDSESVFEALNALRGNSLQRMYRKFCSTSTGDRVLRDKLELLDVLRDRKALSQNSEDSFAHAYLRFVQSESLTAEGLVDASYGMIENISDKNFLRFTNRVRDMHDLWHTLTQYGREPLGEACLLGFTYAQLGNPGIAFLLTLGSPRLVRGYGRGTLHAMWRGYRDGKNASWLAAQPFEELLAMNVDQVRVLLSIPEPTAYWMVLEQHGLRRK